MFRVNVDGLRRWKRFARERNLILQLVYTLLRLLWLQLNQRSMQLIKGAMAIDASAILGLLQLIILYNFLDVCYCFVVSIKLYLRVCSK